LPFGTLHDRTPRGVKTSVAAILLWLTVNSVRFASVLLASSALLGSGACINSGCIVTYICDVADRVQGPNNNISNT